MEKSSNATELVRDHFQEKASSFDALYDEEHPLQRAVRPGLLKRRDFALDVVREYDDPRVLDIGGGSGRVGICTVPTANTSRSTSRRSGSSASATR